MRSLLNIFNFKCLCPAEEVKPTVALLLAAFIPTLHRYFGSIEFAQLTFSNWSETAATTYMFLCAFIFMGILPWLVIRFVFKENLKDYGLQWGDWRLGLSAVLIFLILMTVLLLYPSSKNAEMQAIYPFDKGAADSLVAFARLEITRGLFFYSAWEFFFRGFLLFSLRKSFGDWLAICIQVIPSCLWHIGMPTGEIFGSIFGGVLFGVLVIRTRSIFWAFLLHFLVGVVVDAFIILGM